LLFVTFKFFFKIDCLADVFVKLRDKLSEHDDVAAEAEEYMKKKNILKKYFKSERDAVSIESVITSLKISFKTTYVGSGGDVRIERVQLLYVFDFSQCIRLLDYYHGPPLI